MRGKEIAIAAIGGYLASSLACALYSFYAQCFAADCGAHGLGVSLQILVLFPALPIIAPHLIGAVVAGAVAVGACFLTYRIWTRKER